jgi:hypothetical protein
MWKRYLPRLFGLLCLGGMLISAIFSFDAFNLWERESAAQAAVRQADTTYLPLVASEEPSTAYLPFVAKRAPVFDTFGVEIYRISNAYGLQKAIEAGTIWVRRNGLLWSEVEATQGTYQWNASLEQELKTAQQNGMQVILVVRGTPTWARQYSDYPCGRIKSDALDEFAEFLYQAVKRYSVPPYNVKYWQIWNEPDAPRLLAYRNTDSVYGCWGDPNDPYYGGGYYAEVLKVVYPRMIQAAQEVNTSIKVVVGGLLMGCNPNIADKCADTQSLYLEGILQNGGGNYFDMVAFHAYDFYYSRLGQYGNENWGARWNESTVIAKKAQFLRDILSRYNTVKPLIVTEAALKCGQTGDEPFCQTDTLENTKAYYVAQNYALSRVEGIPLNIWYSLSSTWANTALLDRSNNPKPAYYAYKVVREKLDGATFNRNITEYANVKGYEFLSHGKRIWFVWSIAEDANKNSLPVNITLPTTPSAIWDVFGNAVTPSASLTVEVKPLYIEW